MIEVNFTPSLKQLIAFDLLSDKKTNFIGYGGSARSGKTYLAVSYLIIQCLSYPDTGWGLGRKELKNLKRTTLLTLFKVLKDSGFIKDVDYKYNQQNQVISFRNKSEIFLIDTAYQPSDPLYTRYGGLELTGCVVDESNESPYKAIEILFSRVGWRNNIKYGLGRKMLETFNPDKGHVYRRYYKPYRDKVETDYKRFVPALPSDNPDPAVKEWIIDMKRNADSVTLQRLVYGNFEYDDDPATLISYDAILAYWNGNHVEQTDYTVLTIDVARKGKDKTVFRVWKGWVVVKRYSLATSLVNEVVDKAKSIQIEYKIPNTRTIADEDGVGGGVVDYLYCVGFVNNSSPLGGENYTNLKSQCSILMAKKINNNEVTELCHDSDVIDLTSEEMEQVKIKDIDKDGKLGVIPKEAIKELIGRSPDDWDSIMMRYWFELYNNLNPELKFY